MEPQMNADKHRWESSDYLRPSAFIGGSVVSWYPNAGTSRFRPFAFSRQKCRRTLLILSPDQRFPHQHRNLARAVGHGNAGGGEGGDLGVGGAAAAGDD